MYQHRALRRQGGPLTAALLNAPPALRAVGSRGDSYDNALAESEIGLFKTELIRRRGPWRTLEQVELATLEWVGWFTNRSLHSSIGDVPPVEFEESYYAATEEPKQSAESL